MLWGAVAKVLDNEASARIVRVLALFAISKQTMDSRCEMPCLSSFLSSDTHGVCTSVRRPLGRFVGLDELSKAVS